MSSPGATWLEVGDGCFQRRYRSFDVSVGVVRGGHGLLVVDTRSHDGEAEELLRDLRQLGGPVQVVVNTHWHFDHLFGNHRFRRQAAEPQPGLVEVRPDLPIFGDRMVAARLEGSGEQMRESIVEHLAASAPEQAEQVGSTVIVPPDRAVVEPLRMTFGDRPVELRSVGRGHTDNDLVVLVPDAQVVFAGDLVEQSGPPAIGEDSYPLQWPRTLENLVARTDGFTVVPGHGAAVDQAFVRQQAEQLRLVAETIHRLHRQGVPQEHALQAGAGSWPYPAQVLTHAVARGYQQLLDEQGEHGVNRPKADR